MPRKPEGDHPLTTAERQARTRVRKAANAITWLGALERIASAKTIREAREIASGALARYHERNTPPARSAKMADQTSFPTVAQWQRDEPDAATPLCPSCGQHLGIRLAIWNISGRDEWLCDNACDGNG